MEYKRKKYFLLLIIVTIAFGCNRQPENNSKDLTPESIFSIPLKTIKIKKTVFEVSPEKDTVLNYKTGSKLIISKDAFVDKDGHVIKGKVKLKYREFKNAFDIYFGGVPMTYNDNGEEKVFETAGMIEINATAGGKTVFPNPGKIKLEMTGFQSGSQYNVYKLDTSTGKWKNIGKDTVIIKKYSDELSKLSKVPAKPKIADDLAFSVGDETGKYPELSIYENILFEPVDNKRCEFPYMPTKIQVKNTGNGIYEVTLISKMYGIQKEKTCKCYLAFDKGAKYEKALKVYQKRYEKLIDKREKARKRIEKEWDTYRAAVEKYNVLMSYVQGKKIDLQGNIIRVLRVLQLNDFGFINCDSPTSYPQGAELIANYTDINGNEIRLSNVSLIEKGKNLIFPCGRKIKFNPDKDNTLFGITEDAKLAYIKGNEFKKITPKTGDYTFKMTICDKELKTYDDVMSTLFQN